MAPTLLLAVTILAMAAAVASGSTALPRLGGEVQFVIPNDDEIGVQEKMCNGTVGDCSDEDPINDSMDSARRSLAWTRQRYISYQAMKKNNVPCSRKGTSYYNCRPGKAVNPYRRGCSAITRCARSW